MELPEPWRGPIEEALSPVREGGRGVASCLRVLDGEVVDAAIDLASGRAWRRPLPETRPEALAAWLQLLVRQRGQLAHELSGPATGVLAALETVLEFEPVPSGGREILREARAGLIRFSQLLVQRDPLQPSSGALVEAPLDGLLDRWAQTAAERLDPLGERLSLQVRAPSSGVRLHPAMLDAVISVLLSNAWRARRSHRVHVRVDVRVEGEVLLVTLADDGAGMEAEVLASAGDLGFCGRSNGVGLGLFSVRWALREHGGLLLESRPEGTTATVFCRLGSLPLD